MKRKIPVFYHVPKNAGTYVSNAIMLAFRYYRRKYTDWCKKHIPGKDSIKCIQVLDGGYIIARFIIGDPDHQLENCNSFINKHSNTEWDIQLKDFSKKLIENVFLFGVVLESHGFRNKDSILKLIQKELEQHQLLILRDPFSRAQSLYDYNAREESVHDYDHKQFKSKTFEDYILSEEISDSWLTRALLNVKDSDPLREKDFMEVCSMLDKMHIYDIAQVDNAIRETILSCYNIDMSTIALQEWDFIKKNTTNTKKIKFESLSEICQSVFLQKTKWDKKIYDTYTKHK